MKRQFYLDHCERHLLRLSLEHLRKRAMEAQNYDASHGYCKRFADARIQELLERLKEPADAEQQA